MSTEPRPSYGTAKSGVGISAMSVLRPDLMMKCCVPVVMAGIIAVGIPVFYEPLYRAETNMLYRFTDWSCRCSFLVTVRDPTLISCQFLMKSSSSLSFFAVQRV